MAELLLDSTYLLPIFGVSVGLGDFRSRFTRLLDSFSVVYNPVSLVESKWAVLKKAREDPARRGSLLEAYRRGLKVLESDGRLKETRLTSDVVEAVADELSAKGVRDYFDRVIYGTAAELGCVLLTEDKELLGVRRREGPAPGRVVRWKDVLAS
jgi:PIN domain nuclease of toxin-antitoxin system